MPGGRLSHKKRRKGFRHKLGGRKNDAQVPHNAATLVQQQSVYQDLKTMNVVAEPRVSIYGLCSSHLINEEELCRNH